MTRDEKMKKTAEKRILVVEDSVSTTAFLKKIFENEYEVSSASCGAEAIRLIREEDNFSLVLLDLMISGENGLEVLSLMQRDQAMADIPVIVVTSDKDEKAQLEALRRGAADVVTRPLSPQIVLARARNIIARKELVELSAQNRIYKRQLRDSEIDAKTGIYTRQAFCKYAAQLIAAHPEEKFVIFRWDIDRFKVFNDMFGVAAGDRYLAKIGELYRRESTCLMVSGRWEADHFVGCISLKDYKKAKICDKLLRLGSYFSEAFDFSPRIGLYVIEDPRLDISLMCDRAFLALLSIKGSYSEHEAVYDDSMLTSLLEEQQINSEMEAALRNGEFVVYYQPQYDYAAGRLHGAEALVRWAHPKKGLVPPGRFIPVFEKNGFISRLDEFVWEKACSDLRSWIDAGLTVVPVSVNVSRLDIYDTKLCERLLALVEKYSLDIRLLRLEITESAYMKDPEQLINVVSCLHSSGFKIEMDDFGSGYSSLNSLEEVPVDMLKLDMKFLDTSESGRKRSGNILTSVIRMANWLSLPVIAEGVETREQADYLKSVGAFYMQGYYFARPMPLCEYTSLLCGVEVEEAPRLHSSDLSSVEDFLNASTQQTLIFNSFVGGAAIMEYDGQNVEALRMNDRFFEVLGTTREEYGERHLRIQDRFDSETKKVFLEKVTKTSQTGEEVSCELCSKPIKPGGSTIWTITKMKLLAKTGSRSILYFAIENITERMNLLITNTKLKEQLSAVMNNVPGGIIDAEISQRFARIVYFNDTAAKMFGFSRGEFQARIASNLKEAVNPSDLPVFYRETGKLLDGTSKRVEVTFRHICRDKRWLWVKFTGSVLRVEQGVAYISGILLDVDEQTRSELITTAQKKILERQRASLQALYETIPCGLMQYSCREGVPLLSGFNDEAWRIFGYQDRDHYIEAVRGRRKIKDTHPDDLSMVQEQLNKLLSSEGPMRLKFEHRIIRVDGCVRWVSTLLQKSETPDGAIIQAVFTDITESREDDQKKLCAALFSLYDKVYAFNLDTKTAALKFTNDARPLFAEPIEVVAEKISTFEVRHEDRARLRAFLESARARSLSLPAVIEYRTAPEFSGCWRSLTIIDAGVSTFLVCEKDITALRQAQSIFGENEKLRGVAATQRAEDERARIFIEDTGMLFFDYYPKEDLLKLRRRQKNGGLLTTETPDFLKEIYDNKNLDAESRFLIAENFAGASKLQRQGVINCKISENGGALSLARLHYVSVPDESGAIYRIPGYVVYTSDMSMQNLQGLQLFEATATGASAERISSLYASVLRSLTDAQDTNSAFYALLSTAGYFMGVSRLFIAESNEMKRRITNSLEWCSDNISRHRPELAETEYPDELQKPFSSFFDSQGFIAVSDAAQLEDWQRTALEAQKVKSALFASMEAEGEYRGFIGAEDCARTRDWNQAEKAVLRTLSSLASEYLYKKTVTVSRSLSEEAMEQIDQSPVCLYIIDPYSFELLYCNRTSEELESSVPRIGRECYCHYQGETRPCEECPVIDYQKTGLSIPRAYMKDGRKILLLAVPLLWHGRKTMLVAGIDADCFAVSIKTKKETEMARDLTRYANTLTGLFDEAFVIDLKEDSYTCLIGKDTRQHQLQRIKGQAEKTKAWVEKYVAPEDKARVQAFFLEENVRRSFAVSEKVPSIEFLLQLEGRRKHWCRSTLLRLSKDRYLCGNKDITETKDAEAMRAELSELRSRTEMQRYYRTIVEQTGIAVVEYDCATGKANWTESFGGYAASVNIEQLFNRGVESCPVCRGDEERLEQFLKEMECGREHTTSVLRLKMNDGSCRWTHMAATVIRDENGKPEKIIGTFLDMDEEMRIKSELEQLNDRLSQIITNMPAGVAIVELAEDGVYPVYMSDKSCALFGFTREEYDVRIANGNPVYFVNNFASISAKGRSLDKNGAQFVQDRMQARKKDGSWFWLCAYCSLEKKEDGKLYCCCILVDISSTVATEQHFASEAERYRLLFENIDLVTFEYAPLEDQMTKTMKLPGKVVETKTINGYLEKLNSYETVVTEDKIRLAAELGKALSSPADGFFDFRADYTGQGFRWHRARYISLADAEGYVYRVVGCIDDINDIVTAKNELRRNTRTDKITGLINKDAAAMLVELMLKDRPLTRRDAMVFIDLDDFKGINDSIGHYDADLVLGEIGAVLRAATGRENIAARFGGDEFLLYMSGIKSLEPVIAKVKKIIAQLNRINAGKAQVGCSVGITEIAGPETDFETVFKQADEALYQAKERGKNNFFVYGKS